MKTQEKILCGFIAVLVILEFVKSRLVLDQWTTILLILLVVVVFFDAHPEIVEAEATWKGLRIKRAQENLERIREQKPDLESKIEENVTIAKSESEDSVLAFLGVCSEIEGELRKLATARNLPSKVPFSRLIRELQQAHAFGSFESLIIPSLNDLKSIRSTIAHGQVRLKEDEASSLVDLAAGILAELKSTE